MISKSPTLPVVGSRSSKTQNTSVGGGSRPTPSKVMIPSSAPTDPYGLSRAPAGYLKQTGSDSGKQSGS
jgi:hypothetical protein